MSAAGIGFCVRRSSDVFWCGEPVGPEEEFVDMTFVGDECIVLLADSARKLSNAMRVPLELLALTFG
eukprot:7754205-Pyramimonas_sp.AAC.1